MKFKFLGTAAAEGVPALFCDCKVCREARAAGEKNLRTRTQAIVDDKILIDFPPDTYSHFLTHNIPMSRIHTCLITHSHGDHLCIGELWYRKEGLFAHLDDKSKLTLYGGERSCEMINGTWGKTSLADFVEMQLVKPFQSFVADGYTITPLTASHDKNSSPLVYIIEKDGKTMLYNHDTSDYVPEVWEYLSTCGKKIDFVTSDCTEVTRKIDYVGHMNLERNIQMRKRMNELGLTDEKTIWVLNHFSHNGGEDLFYERFEKIAAKENFLVSYDGMEIEF